MAMIEVGSDKFVIDAAEYRVLLAAAIALKNAIPALERVHAMTPGGPKKSQVLAGLKEARELVAANNKFNQEAEENGRI